MKNWKNRGLALLLIFALLVSMMPAFAADDEVIASGEQGTVSWTLTQDGVLTVTGTGPASWGRYDIPSSLVRHVIIAEGITHIPSFAGYNKLISVELPDTITSLARTFSNCSSLQSVKMSNQMTSIGPEAFLYCSSLELAELPAGIISIGERAFEGCTSLALTELPAGLTSVGAAAFSMCTSLALTELPTGLTSIEMDTFRNCESLALTELPTGVVSIGKNAFQGCTNLALTELPAGITSIEHQAFSGCSRLALTELPAGITSVGQNAFSRCTSLALTELPTGLTTIWSSAFYDCTSLALAELPASCSTIGKDAFANTRWTVKTEHWVKPASESEYVLEKTTYDRVFLGILAMATILDDLSNRHLRVADNNDQHLSEALPTQFIAHGNAIVLRRYYDLETSTVTVNDGNGGSSTQEVPYGEKAVEPEMEERPGFTLNWQTSDGASFDFNTPITGPLSVSPVWTACENTPYQVQHYVQAVSGDDYVLLDTEDLTAATDSQVEAAEKAYTGFHVADHPGQVPSGSVSAEQLTVLKVYYDRDLIQVTIDAGTGDEPQTQTVRYGSTIVKPENPAKASHSFTGWMNESGAAYDFSTPVYGPTYISAGWKKQTVSHPSPVAPPPVDPSPAAPLPNDEEDLEGEDTPLAEHPELNDKMLSRAEAAFFFAQWMGAEVDSLAVTTDFDDVCADTTYAAEITWANNARIEIGYGQRQYGPTDALTREQLAVILFLACKGEDSHTDLTAFDDEDAVSWWAYEAVCWAVSNGLMAAEGGRLRPQDGVTGSEVTALFSRVEALALNI